MQSEFAAESSPAQRAAAPNSITPSNYFNKLLLNRLRRSAAIFFCCNSGALLGVGIFRALIPERSEITFGIGADSPAAGPSFTQTQTKTSLARK